MGTTPGDVLLSLSHHNIMALMLVSECCRSKSEQWVRISPFLVPLNPLYFIFLRCVGCCALICGWKGEEEILNWCC